MKICISCDSTCDIPKDLLEKYDIHLMPITIMLGTEEHHDGIDVTPEDIFNFVDKTNELPKTSAVNIYEYTEYFKKLRQEYDAVILKSIALVKFRTKNYRCPTCCTGRRYNHSS